MIFETYIFEYFKIRIVDSRSQAYSYVFLVCFWCISTPKLMFYSEMQLAFLSFIIFLFSIILVVTRKMAF